MSGETLNYKWYLGIKIGHYCQLHEHEETRNTNEEKNWPNRPNAGVSIYARLRTHNKSYTPSWQRTAMITPLQKWQNMKS